MGGAGAGAGGEVVLVAVDASKEITDYALQWAIQNVVQPGDTLLLLVLLQTSASSLLSSLGKLQLYQTTKSNRNNQSGFQQLFASLFKKWGRRDVNDSHRGKGVNEGSIKRINEVCVEMMNELCRENNVMRVRTHVIVTLIPAAHIGSVADKAEEYQARWLILDRRLKKESESCLTCLNCNIILVDHAIPKILRLIDASSTEEESDDTDVFTVRHRSHDSTATSSGGQDLDSSFNTSGSLGSSMDMDGTIPPPMVTRFPPSSPLRYLNSSAGAGYQEHRTAPPRSRTPTKGTDKKIGGTVKAFSDGRSSLDSRSDIQKSSETLTETNPPASDGVTGFPVSHRNVDSMPSRSTQGPELSSNISGSLGPRTDVDAAIARDFSPSRPSPNRNSNLVARSQERRAVPARSSFNNHLMFAKPPIPAKGRDRNFSGPQDAFSQGRRSVDSWSRIQSSEIPSETKPPLRMNSFKHVIEVVEPTVAPPIDRMSSVRRAMSLSIKKPPIPPPLCSVCRYRAPVFGKPPRKFSYQELERATDGFAAANFLAEGGYGTVYRGVLEDGQVVAVKQRRKVSAQGASEFCSEVEVLSCAQHRNLVMLIGYCMDKEWLLVYEFVCNRSLEKHLHGNDMEEVMAWHHRQKVAVGAARGLRYLHEDCRVGCIVHRDFRPNNILLTHDFEPMVGDFGLARWQVDGQSAEETRIVGTFGYLAPEYTQTGQITEKADVYAFGVLLMELISGVKAIDLARCTGQQSLSQWASPLMDRKMMYGLTDPRLNGNYVEQEVECMMYAAGLCISSNPELRPRMSKVLRILEGDMPSDIAAHRQPQTPPDAVLLARTDQTTHTLQPKNSSYSSYEESMLEQSSGTPVVDEQLKRKNVTKPPLPPQAFKSGIDEMKQAGDRHILNQNEQLANKEYRAYLEGAVIEYIQSSQELAFPKRGTYRNGM